MIIVDEGGDILLYETIEQAALELEAIDVMNGECEVFDSRGAVLVASAEGQDEPVSINPTPVRFEPEELHNRLANFVLRVGADRFGLTVEKVAVASLELLILAIQEFQLARS